MQWSSSGISFGIGKAVTYLWGYIFWWLEENGSDGFGWGREWNLANRLMTENLSNSMYSWLTSTIEGISSDLHGIRTSKAEMSFQFPWAWLSTVIFMIVRAYLCKTFSNSVIRLLKFSNTLSRLLFSSLIKSRKVKQMVNFRKKYSIQYTMRLCIWNYNWCQLSNLNFRADSNECKNKKTKTQDNTQSEEKLTCQFYWQVWFLLVLSSCCMHLPMTTEQ